MAKRCLAEDRTKPCPSMGVSGVPAQLVALTVAQFIDMTKKRANVFF
jgi:hypothetical protein